MNSMVFKGFDDNVYFGDGEFTVGKSYHYIDGSLKKRRKDSWTARFIDDSGHQIWENTRYFESEES